MGKWEKLKEKWKNLWWKNEQKLRKLTKDVFCQVKICCLHTQLFISIRGPGLYGPRNRLNGPSAKLKSSRMSQIFFRLNRTRNYRNLPDFFTFLIFWTKKDQNFPGFKMISKKQLAFIYCNDIFIVPISSRCAKKLILRPSAKKKHGSSASLSSFLRQFTNF